VRCSNSHGRSPTDHSHRAGQPRCPAQCEWRTPCSTRGTLIPNLGLSSGLLKCIFVRIVPRLFAIFPQILTGFQDLGSFRTPKMSGSGNFLVLRNFCPDFASRCFEKNFHFVRIRLKLICDFRPFLSGLGPRFCWHCGGSCEWSVWSSAEAIISGACD